MSNLVPVVYVGNKPHAFDNIAHSGKSWQGKGDVQEATDAQAKLLLKYPDQWALANEADRAAVEAPVSIEGKDENGEAVTIDPDDLKKPLEKMNKAELSALAKQSWDKELDPAMTKKAMIDQIEEWQHELGA
jgi:pyruvate-formate lyase